MISILKFKGGTDMGSSMKKRLTSAFAALLFVLFIFVSSVYIIKHTDHHCTGEDCPICTELTQLRNTIRSLDTGAHAAVTAETVTVVLLLTAVIIPLSLAWSTPVSLKVRLLN